jgi:hypothetical protein
MDRATSVNDQRHRLVLSGLWQLNYAKSLPSAVHALLAGWGISGILTGQSGQPYSGLLNYDLNNDGNFAADRTPGLGRNTFYMPRQAALDVRLAREVFLEKRVKLLLIWEGFNALNRGNITDVNRTQYAVLGRTSSLACGIAGAPCLFPLNTGTTAFGASRTAAAPRIMQLALKLVF